MVVALLALIFSLGGTAVASFGPFRGDEIIKKKSLSGNRLKDNSVTGRQIKSSTLGTVPSAVHARTADLATNLDQSSLKGLIRGQMVDLNMFSGDPAKSVKVGPYQLQERCFDSDGTVAQINVIGPAGSVESEYSVVESDTTDDGTFSQGHAVPSTTPTNVVQIYDFHNFKRAGGTLVVRSDAGQMVQLDFSLTTNNALRPTPACHVWGTATTGN